MQQLNSIRGRPKTGRLRKPMAITLSPAGRSRLELLSEQSGLAMSQVIEHLLAGELLPRLSDRNG